MKAAVALAAAFAAAAFISPAGHALPLDATQIAALCGQADGLAHCGRLVEEVQLRRAPHLATRDGNKLTVHLSPTGDVVFGDVDATTVAGGRSYSLWDYLDELNAVVLYATAGDSARFIYLQRNNGKTSELPAEPWMSPDRQRLVTADFCPTQCVNELAVWRVTGEGLRKEAFWAPDTPWSDASAHWTAADALVIEYTLETSAQTRRLARKLTDPDWRRVGP